MVCDEGRWCVGVCDKAVCEIWCVWKLCVKESVWQSCVWKMVCDKVVCERWCGERWCVTKFCWFFFKKMRKMLKKTWCTFDALLMHFWNYIKYQKCIKNLWNYIESASKWCSFKSASKVHHVFQSFADFSKNMLKCSKTWCTFDALMMHFWNYIKSASKPFETKSKVQNYVVSKAHQKCIKSASSFLDISTCIFFFKMSCMPK